MLDPRASPGVEAGIQSVLLMPYSVRSCFLDVMSKPCSVTLTPHPVQVAALPARLGGAVR